MEPAASESAPVATGSANGSGGRRPPGRVWLVGGGPGDPGLLTCRARELFEQCDVICYDELISPAVLALAPAGTPLIPTGYRGYKGTALDYGMHPEVIRQALAGRSVLRLKAGDPFIFGRATEECRELDQHGIPWEAVPGITAALGAAVCAGFPLTSAGVASDVTFASGHRTSQTISSWATLGASTGSLVLYMGAKKLARHAEKLIELGRSADTPVAHISSATTAQQVVTTGTLQTIGEKVLALNCDAPALVVMGDVVSLRQQMDWRARLPMSGQQVLLVGDTADSALAAHYRSLGAVVLAPPLLRQLPGLGDTDWQRVTALSPERGLVFADAAAVDGFWHTLSEQALDVRRLIWPLYAASESAGQALAQRGLFNVRRCSAASRPVGSLLLTGHSGADPAAQPAGGAEPVIACRQQPLELQFKLSQIDLAVISDVAACRELLRQQPAALAGAGQVLIYGTDTETESDTETGSAEQGALLQLLAASDIRAEPFHSPL